MALEGKRVLYISYNGMLDALGQSQVIPYLRELSKRGVRFTLLSFERAAAFTGKGLQQKEELRLSLAADKIEWHCLRYHQTPSLPATIFDVLMGVRAARRIVREQKIDMVHARSHIPATMALALKRRFGIKMIFDVRGLLADEYVDAGHWQQGSLPYRLTKEAERRAFAAADGVVTLTESIWPLIKEWDGLRNRTPVHAVIPCCADLELFTFNQVDRDRRRAELGLQERFVIVYSGSIDGWYLTEQMADFFVHVLNQHRDAHLLWLTPTKHERVKSLMQERNISPADYTVVAVAPGDVPSYLSASDAGLAFIKPCLSKLASSPTKYAEYLGCGLPLIINSGIGDSDALITREGVGALLTDFDEENYASAVRSIESFAQDVEGTRRRTREVAERLFDVRRVGVEGYGQLYEAVLRRET
jgi:glycosyltransferase involved in cell wall biosynthesis